MREAVRCAVLTSGALLLDQSLDMGGDLDLRAFGGTAVEEIESERQRYFARRDEFVRKRIPGADTVNITSAGGNQSLTLNLSGTQFTSFPCPLPHTVHSCNGSVNWDTAGLSGTHVLTASVVTTASIVAIACVCSQVLTTTASNSR